MMVLFSDRPSLASAQDDPGWTNTPGEASDFSTEAPAPLRSPESRERAFSSGGTAGEKRHGGEARNSR